MANSCFFNYYFLYLYHNIYTTKSMKRLILSTILLLCCVTLMAARKTTNKAKADLWPDGTPISEWFHDATPVDVAALGPQFRLTDHGIFADGRIHTKEIQALIDSVAGIGGGVIVVGPGIYETGGLHFRQGTHLHLEQGATLLGSDFIGDYPLGETRIEGESCTYFGALINVDGLDGFTITGKGTIDGNGLRYHQSFWLRRKWNRQCTNKDEQRPRLVYISNSKNIQIEGVSMQNSAFWTNHVYNSENIKFIGVHIYSLGKPNDSKGPSTDAIDLDVVKNVLIKNCYMAVNDDAVAIKGGKGPYADAFMHEYPGVEIPKESIGNGKNENVIIEDCEYGFCHSCLTMGSECVYSRNFIMRRIHVGQGTHNLLWLKMRPDTPQHYEYITVEDATGEVVSFLNVYAWRQFFDLKGRKDYPVSYANNVTMRNCNITCGDFFNPKRDDEIFRLKDFTFENVTVRPTRDKSFNKETVDGFVEKNVVIE